MERRLAEYFAILGRLPERTLVTGEGGQILTLAAFFAAAIPALRAAHARGNKIVFIGNGGSSAIATHMANDFSKNGHMRALALTDGATLTCLGNDYGFEHIFSKQIEMLGAAGDVLVAISSSGNSPDILNGVAAARALGFTIITMSGFRPDNRLRGLGDYNLYVANEEYGFVEVTHQALIHAVLDIACGWGAAMSGVPGDAAATAATAA